MANCDICQGLNPEIDRVIELRLRAIRQSARVGCSSCFVLRTGLENCICFKPESNTRVRIIRKQNSKFFAKAMERGGSWSEVEFHTIEGRRNSWNLRSYKYPIEPNTGSHSTMKLALKWLQICNQKHSCSANDGFPSLPSRVIDIAQMESSRRVKLLETNGQKSRYVCLSYCWGKSQSVLTTKENLESHTDGILLSDLPRTFQDAIYLTDHLKVRYIWIDSLCIVQDSKEDWEGEAAKMADIYHRSYLTIAASWAPCGNDGLFKQISCLEVLHTIARPAIRHIHDDASYFPLMGRAWAYQERILSPRLLHFGPQEISWECFGMEKCACGKSNFSNIERIRKEDYAKLVFQNPAASTNDLAQLWRRITLEYSCLSLSMSSDKLPALSGLAEHLRPRRHGKYLAGLWEDSLVLDMLWYQESENISPIPAGSLKFRAPSWSWISVDGAVGWDRRLYWGGRVEEIKVYCNITGCECIPAGQSITGEVVSGYIQMECFMLDGVLFGWQITVGDLRIRYAADNRSFKVDGVVHLIRMALLTSDCLLVVRLVDPIQQSYQRIGYTCDSRSLAWPTELKKIKLI